MKIKFLVILLLSISLNAKHLHKEKFYQNIFCKKINGVTEYVLDDKSRVDCLTTTYAIEVDFANKWAESIGQSLFYAIKTEKKPAVLLIMERGQKDIKYLKRFNTVAKKHGIQLFTIDRNLVIKRYK